MSNFLQNLALLVISGFFNTQHKNRYRKLHTMYTNFYLYYYKLCYFVNWPFITNKKFLTERILIKLSFIYKLLSVNLYLIDFQRNPISKVSYKINLLWYLNLRRLNSQIFTFWNPYNKSKDWNMKIIYCIRNKFVWNTIVLFITGILFKCKNN